MAYNTSRSQGGTHAQHLEAGKQIHKNNSSADIHHETAEHQG